MSLIVFKKGKKIFQKLFFYFFLLTDWRGFANFFPQKELEEFLVKAKTCQRHRDIKWKRRGSVESKIELPIINNVIDCFWKKEKKNLFFKLSFSFFCWMTDGDSPIFPPKELEEFLVKAKTCQRHRDIKWKRWGSIETKFELPIINNVIDCFWKKEKNIFFSNYPFHFFVDWLTGIHQFSPKKTTWRISTKSQNLSAP